MFFGFSLICVANTLSRPYVVEKCSVFAHHVGGATISLTTTTNFTEKPVFLQKRVF
jgi:hypothetical protein